MPFSNGLVVLFHSLMGSPLDTVLVEEPEHLPLCLLNDVLVRSLLLL